MECAGWGENFPVGYSHVRRAMLRAVADASHLTLGIMQENRPNFLQRCAVCRACWRRDSVSAQCKSAVYIVRGLYSAPAGDTIRCQGNCFHGNCQG
jgi:hypothetical protein